MSQEQIIVTVPPQGLSTLRGRAVTPGHLAYRLGRGSRLLRADAPPLHGGLMVVGLGEEQTPAQPDRFCQEVVRECFARGFSGVMLDFEARTPQLERLANRLDRQLTARRLSLLVPEAYGMAAPRAGVVVSSALSGGTLTGRVQEVQQQFGADRVVLGLEKSAEDFLLPSPSGCGTPISQEELQGLLDRLRPCVFFSAPLCARYFTYMGDKGSAHFVLFDDGDTMLRKLEVGRDMGVSRFVLPWTELEACLPIDGLRSRR